MKSRELRLVVPCPFWKRASAFIIDLLILLPFQALPLVVADTFSIPRKQAMPTVQLIGFIFFVLYFTAFESSRLQATPGKLILKLRVTDMTGKSIPVWRALLRSIAKIISGLPILLLGAGYLMAAWTEKGQALHDLIVQTLVLERRYLEKIRSSQPPAAPDSSPVTLAKGERREVDEGGTRQ